MEEKKGFIAEFKEFALRGSVMDMAIGVIIGAAFKAIIDSLVNDVLMPIVGIFIKTESLATLSINIAGTPILIGSFLQAIVNFLIMALVLFLMVRTLNRLRRKKPEPEAAPPEPSTEEKLLTEIRDLLKKDSGK